MKNLEQVRAEHAIKHASALSRQAVRKLPALVLANGLLAATAFSLDSESRRDMRSIWIVIAEHLHKRGHLRVPLSGPDDNTKIKGFLSEICAHSSIELQQATSEALAYLGYLKRFTPKPPGEPDGSED